MRPPAPAPPHARALRPRGMATRLGTRCATAAAYSVWRCDTGPGDTHTIHPPSCPSPAHTAPCFVPPHKPPTLAHAHTNMQPIKPLVVLTCTPHHRFPVQGGRNITTSVGGGSRSATLSGLKPSGCAWGLATPLAAARLAAEPAARPTPRLPKSLRPPCSRPFAPLLAQAIAPGHPPILPCRQAVCSPGGAHAQIRLQPAGPLVTTQSPNPPLTGSMCFRSRPSPTTAPAPSPPSRSCACPRPARRRLGSPAT